MQHTFKLGDRVLFNPKAGPDAYDFFFTFSLITLVDRQEGEVWEVVRTLPPAGGVNQYHIRSTHNGRQRLANGPQLRPAL